MLIVGATSAIAAEVARRYAGRGASLVLTGRNPARLAAVGDDLRVRGATVETEVLDVLDRDRHAAVVRRDVLRLDSTWPSWPMASFRTRSAARWSPVRRPGCWSSTWWPPSSSSPCSHANSKRKRSGTIAVISSVAGDRGRRSNYVYGAAKAGVSVFLQGLRQRLRPAGVRVVTLKPGFVDTPMTAHLTRNPLASSPRRAGRAIYRAIEARRDVAYIPWFWRPVMALIRAMPETLFKRLRL